MAEPKVSILLTLVDKLTAPVEGAKGKLASFGETVTSLGAKVAALGVSAALGAFFKSAISEGIKAEQSYTRLGLAVNNAGENFDALRPQLDDAVRGVTKLSTATDDDLNMALAQLVSATGDVEGSMKNLGLVADVAAYKQISVQDAALLLGKAMAGNTKVFTEFGIVGGTAGERMEALRKVVGGFAENEANTLGGRLSNVNREWGEFKESVGLAIVGSDRLGGSVGGMTLALADLNDWMNKHQESFGKFVDKIVAAGSAIVKVGGFIVEHTPNLYTASKAWDWLTGSTKATAVATADAIYVMGNATTNLRKLTEKEVEAIASVQENGASRISASQRAALLKVAGYIKEHGLLSIRLNTEQATAIEAVVKESGRRRVDFAKTEAKEKEAVWTGSANVFKDSERQREEAAKEAESVIRSSWGLSSDYIIAQTNKLVASHRIEAAALATIVDGLDGVYGAATSAAPAVGKIGNETLNAARGAISLGKEMGVINEAAASALGNVVNLADSLKDGLKGISAGNLVGAIGSLAGLLGGIFGEGPQTAARRALFEKNNQRLQELRDRMGELIQSSTPLGKIADFKGLNSEQLIASNLDRSSVTQLGKNVSVGSLSRSLAMQGLSLTDLRDLAREFNIDLQEKNGNVDAGALRQLFAYISGATVSGFGGGIAGELNKLGFLNDANGGGATGTLQGLAAILGAPGVSSAFGGIFQGVNLDDGIDAGETSLLTGRTRGVASGYASGELDSSAFRGLTNAQIQSILPQILQALQAIAGNTGTAAVAGVATADAIAGGAMASTVGVQTADSYAMTGFNSGRV